MSGDPDARKVIVVGAGPVGLTCALGLAQRGIPVVVLEANDELFFDLRAGSFHPPTLEVLKPFGITERLLKIGIPVHRWQLRDRLQGIVGTFELSLLGDETEYPFRLHCEQHKYTPLLMDLLAAQGGVEVLFGHRVAAVEANARGVVVQAETSGGPVHLRGEWIIGADGGGSVVRKAAGIAFSGFTYPERFALISTPYDLGASGFTDTAYISHPVEWCALFRLPHEGPPGLWRFLYGCDPEETEDEALSDSRVQARLQAVLPIDGSYEIVHRTIYRVHQRVAERFRSGRFLIAGDAAHLNNPIGGFGLNSGLQDAANLVAKLAAVWHGDAEDDTLDLYDRQRRHASVAHVQEASIRNKRMLEETDPEVRAARLAEMASAAHDPARAKAILMRSSMIDSFRAANATC